MAEGMIHATTLKEARLFVDPARPGLVVLRFTGR